MTSLFSHFFIIPLPPVMDRTQRSGVPLLGVFNPQLGSLLQQMPEPESVFVVPPSLGFSLSRFPPNVPRVVLVATFGSGSARLFSVPILDWSRFHPERRHLQIPPQL
jgi:hypothetical protein